MISKTQNPWRILTVEDDETISEAVCYNLKRRGHQCLTARTGLEALRLARRERPDLMILDLMLPEMDGWKVCEQLRQEGDDVPIIILSARTSEFDKVQALTLGADDYLTKPFGMKELIARVEAQLRRHRKIESGARKLERITVDGLEVDPKRKEAFVEAEPLNLTSKEFAVLHLLVRESPKVISREDIYRSVWGYEMLHGDRSVDVFVRRIRKKLADTAPGRSFVQTHYGFGYKLEVSGTGSN